jgi:hypothetical protein
MTPDPYKANNGGPGDPRDPGSTGGSGTSGSGTNGSGTLAGTGGLINLNCQHLYGSAYANCMGQQQQD